MSKKIFFKSIISWLILIIILFIGINLVDAQGIVPSPSGGGNGDYTINDFIVLAVNISQWILGIVGSLTLVMFVWGGVMFILSGGASDKVNQAKKIIVAAIVGLIIVFSSWLIIRFSISTISDKEQFQLQDGSQVTAE